MIVGGHWGHEHSDDKGEITRLKTDYCESIFAKGVFILRPEIRGDGRIEEIEKWEPRGLRVRN